MNKDKIKDIEIKKIENSYKTYEFINKKVYFLYEKC